MKRQATVGLLGGLVLVVTMRVLVEAREEPGGRLRTVRKGGIVIEKVVSWAPGRSEA
ncbi:FAD-dependent oxidoreductase [Streptomyces sp. NBC_01717]|uniref:FAD-dependent oxidoreductase n=1 Tax=Streptomyces sp. NBC_01717 TaxID=2975918 RepID=UPI002E2F33E3|nr:FAD-dependent oxidoreductase [Streptomyces sp. NBC_01717]